MLSKRLAFWIYWGYTKVEAKGVPTLTKGGHKMEDKKQWLNSQAARLKDYSPEEIKALAASLGYDFDVQYLRQWKISQSFVKEAI
jgi:hypothetical protein